MFRLCLLLRSAKAKYLPVLNLFNAELSKLLDSANGRTQESTSEKMPKSFFVEHKHESHHYYGLFVHRLTDVNAKAHKGDEALEALRTALNVFDCPFTKRVLRSQLSSPIHISKESAVSIPTENDACILFLRYPRRYSRSLAEVAKAGAARNPTQRSALLSNVNGIPGIILEALPSANDPENDRSAFFYQAYLVALRVLFPNAYQSLVESNIHFAQEEISEPLIHALNLLSEFCLLKKNCGMGYFYVVHNLVHLLRQGIKEEIQKVQTHADFEQCVRKHENSSETFNLLPSIFSTKEIEWGECKQALYVSCVHLQTVNDDQTERSTIATITPSPFLSWYSLYVEALKSVDIGTFYAYNSFIDQEKSLKLSPALNALGVITLCIKKFYGRKLIAVTNGEQRELTCNLIYLVERDLTDQIIKLESLEQRSTAMPFFSYSTTTKKEAIKQCAMLATVTFFPQIFEQVKQLDWYPKSTPIIAGASAAPCPMHSIATEVYHSSQTTTQSSNPFQATTAFQVVKMLDELFQKETSTLPEYLKGAKIVADAQRVKMNLSGFQVVRILAQKQQSAVSVVESDSTDEKNDMPLDFLADDAPSQGEAAQSGGARSTQIQLAQVFSKSRGAATLQACCMVVQTYFPSHLEDFARYVIINQERCLLEEWNAWKSREKNKSPQESGTLQESTRFSEIDVKSRLEDKEPFIQRTQQSIRESLSDQSVLSEIIHNLFIFNKRKPQNHKLRDLTMNQSDRIDVTSNISIFRACVQKAARLNLKPLMENVADISAQVAAQETLKPVETTQRVSKVSLRTIGEKTVIESTTSQYPLKSMLSLYKFLASESEFCLKHVKVEQIRGYIHGKPFANVPIVHHSMGTNLLCVGGLENLLRALMMSQYGYELQIGVDEEIQTEQGVRHTLWKAKCAVSLRASFVENGKETITNQLESCATPQTTSGVVDFSAQTLKTGESLSHIATAQSAQSKNHCLRKLYAAVIIHVFPEIYAEVILKNEAEGLVAATEVLQDIQSDQSIHVADIIESTKNLPISVVDSCHFTNLRVAFALVAKFLPVEEVHQCENGYKALLYKESGSQRQLILETESKSKIYAIFKAYESLGSSLGLSQIDSIQRALDGSSASTEPIIKAGENTAGKVKPMLELYHRINESLQYNPGSRVLPEKLLEYGLKLQYGIELMVGVQKGDNCWTTMLYGVLSHKPHPGGERAADSSASVWDREWDLSSRSTEVAVKRIFLAGCTCHTKANSLKMACIHVMLTALPSFYALCPTLSSWQTPSDFIELIENDEETI